MWQTPNQGGGPPSQGKKRRKAKRIFHIKRMDALCEILAPGETPDHELVKSGVSTTVRLILNDFSIKGAGIFSSMPLVSGQQLQMTLTEPRKIVLYGKVAWCQEHNLNSHIISKELYAFRAGIEFVLKSVDESVDLQDFLDEILSQHLAQK